MKTKTINVYSFDELSETAQQRALDLCREFQVDYGWWDAAYDNAESVHLEISEFDLGGRRSIDIAFTSSAEETAHAIVDAHSDDCDTHKLATDYLAHRDNLIDTWPRTEDGNLSDEWTLDRKLDDLDEDFRQQLGECYLCALDREWDYLTSDESVRELIEANEYEFTADGDLA